MNAPLRSEIEAQVRFETPLPASAPSARADSEPPAAYGFRSGAEEAYRRHRFVHDLRATGSARVRIHRTRIFHRVQPVGGVPRYADGDWIVITGQPGGGRQIQLAIRHDNLPAIWQALSATGASLV